MLKRGLGALVIVLSLFVLAENEFAPTFQECVNQETTPKSAESSKNNTLFVVVAIESQGICSLRLIDAHNGFFATFASFIIAAFTIILGLFTVSLARSTRTAAIAARDSADATIAVERARFYVVIGKHTLDKFIKAAVIYPNSEGMPMQGNIRIEYSFKNYGRTPGLIVEISHGVSLSAEPPDPVYTVIRQAPVEYMIPDSGSTETYAYEGELGISSIADAKLVETGHKIIWFYGRFDYRDVVTKQPQVHRFYFRYIRTEAGGFRFQSFDYKRYNEST